MLKYLLKTAEQRRSEERRKFLDSYIDEVEQLMADAIILSISEYGMNSQESEAARVKYNLLFNYPGRQL